ncbi:MAG TPA: hypothetical protein K8V07_01510 [Bacteroides xylanisolvens]|uniref:Uncharacterized protein n=1 Tax=Bacteroides xylanisolvens TaxID=371601 RepID=A0A921I308_9BACE|nr:hypothetical protein [Bacteroides xylanisolvens]
MEIYISIIGAIVAILVAIIGAVLANRNMLILQTRKLKEEHYIAYIEALHYLISNNNDEAIKQYVLMRDKLFLMASEEVIKELLQFEHNGVGKSQEVHDKYLTNLIKAIRVDLKLKNNQLPILYFKR